METVLCIDDFHPSLNNSEKSEILNYFGAEKIFYPKQGPKKSQVYAKFKSFHDASFALKRIHQLNIMGQRLNAVYAKQEDISRFVQITDKFPESKLGKGSKEVEVSIKAQERWKEFQKTLIGLAPHLKVDFPLSPALKFLYPAPNKDILNQICKTLVAVPRFYYQVLHLMNKMNLPCPLVGKPSAFAEEEISNDVIAVENMDITTDESEIESDSEAFSQDRESCPVKRPKRQRIHKKKLKLVQSLPKVKQPQSSDPSLVFEIDLHKPKFSKALNINVKTSSFNDNDVHEENVFKNETKLDCSIEVNCQSGFGIIKPTEENQIVIKATEPSTGQDFISEKELKASVLSQSQWSEMPVFNKYREGDPSNRLYIKNISKQATSDDLRKIYGGYIDWTSEQQTLMFDIRLMTEGRMKGQAFISFPDVHIATQALKDTNSFMLKGKPLVVQFARSARPKENPK